MNIIAKSHINLLVRLARTDRDMVPEEKKLIQEVAKGYGFDTTMISQLINRPEPIESLSGLSESKKFEFLYTSMALMVCDNSVNEREMVLYRDIAYKLGYVIKVVEYMRENFFSMSRERLMEEVFARFK